jgi:hypothetical protein
MNDVVRDAIRTGLELAREDGRHREQMRIADWVRRMADTNADPAARALINAIAKGIEGRYYANRKGETK